jgi:fumarate reductase subunit D
MLVPLLLLFFFRASRRRALSAPLRLFFLYGFLTTDVDADVDMVLDVDADVDMDAATEADAVPDTEADAEAETDLANLLPIPILATTGTAFDIADGVMITSLSLDSSLDSESLESEESSSLERSDITSTTFLLLLSLMVVVTLWFMVCGFVFDHFHIGKTKSVFYKLALLQSVSESV